MRRGIVSLPWIVFGLCALQPANGEPEANEIAAIDGCGAGTDFARYRIRSARLVHPLPFLRWVQPAINGVSAKVEGLKGRPFSYAEVRGVRDEIWNSAFLPDSGEWRMRVNIVMTVVENCGADELDLVYYVFSSQFLPSLTTTFESRDEDHASPQSTLGMNEGGRYRLVPLAGYNRTDRLFAGGRLTMSPASPLGPVRSFSVEGAGSNSSRHISAALAGAAEEISDLLSRAEWQVDYLHAESPTDRESLRQGRLSAQLTAATRPLGQKGIVVRFGGLIEGGNLQSGFAPGALAADTLASSGYGALRLYAGATSRFRRQAFSASYGVELGASDGSAALDWHKHIVDVAHDWWKPIKSHRTLELESRFTAGRIAVPGQIPLAARFFGGNREQNFASGDTWQIRSNPVVRSIPSNRFYRTADGAGASSFAALNLTAGYPVFHKPVVPAELSQSPDFEPLLQGQLTTATSATEIDYRTRDRAYRQAIDRLPAVGAALARMTEATAAVEPTLPDEAGPAWKRCRSAISTAERRLQAAVESRGGGQYGRVEALLPASVEEDRLNRVLCACVGEPQAELAGLSCSGALNLQLKDEAIRRAGEEIGLRRDELEADFGQIDQELARTRAAREMSFVKRALDTILKEMNLISLSPVLVFDAARIGPAPPGGGLRYAIGGGARVTLVSHVSFTAGYAWNPDRRPGEGPGAMFFSLRFRDLFE
jgi:hypothetical protein